MLDERIWVFTKYWSTRIFHYNHRLSWQRMVRKRKKTFIEHQFCDLKFFADGRGRGRMTSLVHVDRKATVIRLTTLYNSGRQKSIFERTTCRTLKQLGYSSRKPCLLSLLSDNKKARIQFAKDDKNRRLEKISLVWRISISFCDIRLAHSERHKKDMKIWIPALCQMFRLVLVV